MDERLKHAIAIGKCVMRKDTKTVHGYEVSEIATEELRLLVKAATERDTLAKALEVAVKALQEVNEQSGKYIGCRCPSEENGGMGDCWPCRMIMIGFIPQDALSEIERIKGEK
jgi:hypothetical protein